MPCVLPAQSAPGKRAEEKVEIDDPSYHMWREFGPWTKKLAQKYAFNLPVPDREMRVNYGAPGTLYEPITPEEQMSGDPNAELDVNTVTEVRKKCAEKPEVAQFFPGDLMAAGP